MSDNSVYFNFSATLRIHGHNLDFHKIEAALCIAPTHSHREGESRRVSSLTKYKDDAWHYTANVSEDEPLGVHLNELWRVISANVQFIRKLKLIARVDIFCGYRTNCDHAGFEVPYEALRIFNELEIPFGVSVIVLPDE